MIGQWGPLPTKLWQAAFLLNLIPETTLAIRYSEFPLAFAAFGICLVAVVLTYIAERLLDRHL